ncbi:MAG: beta-galactosidase [Treponema sp.]|jgi:hypothetical protein|nr:beta-galactosidase [Treponema sp.]
MGTQKWWVDYPWRMVQTNMRQIDWADINAEQYVRDLRSFDATVVLLNASGIIANYPVNLDFEPRNLYLTGDSINKIIEACHDAGIRVLARTDYSKIREPVYERHPDWAFRDAAGNIVNYNGDVHVCPNGPYQQEFMFRIISDMFSRLPFDGIFYNMGGFQTRDYSNNYHGLCHCENCKRKFRDRWGLSLPTTEDLHDPTYRKYKVFQDECMADLNKRLTAHVRAISEDIAINGIDYQRIESNTELGRPLPQWQYSASSNTRNSRSFNYDIIPSNTSVDFIGFSYRHVSVSPHQQELRLWQDLANLGGVDYYLIGRLDNHGDRSSFPGIQKVFHFAAENYEELKGLRNLAKVLVLHKAHWDDDPEARGWVRVLTEAHIPLEEAQLGSLSSLEQLISGGGIHGETGFRLVILPDLKYISNEQAKILDDYVQQGGIVLATGETGFYDNYYEPRSAIPLKSLGIAEVLCYRKDVLSAMFLVDEPINSSGHVRVAESSTQKSFPHFDDARYIACGPEYISVRSEPDAKSLLPLLPPQPFGPPERCYAQNPAVDLPALTRFPLGTGAGIYIPWRPGTLFYREGYLNTAWFMQDVVEHICGVKNIAPALNPMVEVTLSARPTGHGKASRIVVQLVNTSGHYGNSFYAPLPARDIGLEIPLHHNTANSKAAPKIAAPKVKTVRTLRGKETLPWSVESAAGSPDSIVTFTLPVLEDYEGIVIELEE